MKVTLTALDVPANPVCTHSGRCACCPARGPVLGSPPRIVRALYLQHHPDKPAKTRIFRDVTGLWVGAGGKQYTTWAEAMRSTKVQWP